MNISNYNFDRKDLVVATEVNSYLEKLTLTAREETLAGIVKQDGAETVIDSSALATLIEAAKAAAVITVEGWKEGEGVYQKTLEYIRSQLPTVDGKKYIAGAPREFLRFIEDWARQ